MKKNFIKCAVPLTGREEINEVSKVIKSGNFVSGKIVKKFEEEFSNYLGVKYSCAVNSCTAALHVVLAALGIKKNDEVIVPPLTFVSSITSVIHNGSIPIFADIDPNTFCISPEDVEKKITKSTKAIIAVHFAGNVCDMKKLRKISKKNNLFLIEDCAQAIGATFNNKLVGTFGDASVFSFYSTKHITTGEGGMISTNIKEVSIKSKMIRSHGLSGRNDHNILGYNYRMSELNAAIGRVQLKKLNKFLARRIKFSNFLLDEIKKLKKKSIFVPEIPSNIQHVYFWCVLKVNTNLITTQEIIDHFNSRGIELRYRYTEPLYYQEIFKKLNHDRPEIWQTYSNLKLKNSEKICGNLIGIPNHIKLTLKDMKKIIKVIDELE